MNDVIAQIDAEIARLQQAKALLGGGGVSGPVKSGRRGRPKGSKNATVKAAAEVAPAKTAARGKRKLTPEGRKAISEALKRRHAERRKLAGK